MIELEYVPVARVEDIPNGGRIYVEFGGMIIVVFNIAGNYYATGDVCSHDNGPIGDGELDGYQLVCPRHGARFDVRNGKALTLPAVEDIPYFPTRVMDGQVEIGVQPD